MPTDSAPATIASEDKSKPVLEIETNAAIKIPI